MTKAIPMCQDTITKEEVEKCKQRDLLENMLAEMAGEFPALSRVGSPTSDTVHIIGLVMHWISGLFFYWISAVRLDIRNGQICRGQRTERLLISEHAYSVGTGAGMQL